MRRLPLSSPQRVKVAYGGYRIDLNDDQVPEFLELAKQVKWPASRGEFTDIHSSSPSKAVLLLPYLDYVDIQALKLDSGLAKALAEAAQHRVIAVRCERYPPTDAESALPVLLKRKRVMVLGPSPAVPIDPVSTWDLDLMWQLLVNHRSHILKLFHWCDRQLDYMLYEQGFRRTALNRELLSSALHSDHLLPDDFWSILLRSVITASNP